MLSKGISHQTVKTLLLSVGAKTTKPMGNTVLIVDDNAVNRLVAKILLEEGGYHVDMAEDGEEAVTKCH